MALVPQTIEVPFEGGVDTKTDRKKVLPTKLLNLENARFDGQEIRSRAGSEYLPDGKVTGGSLTTANALSTVAGELIRWDDTGVYGRASTTPAPWVQRGDAVDAAPLGYESRVVAQRARSCELPDVATLAGVTVYAWTEAQEAGVLSARRTLRVTVIDETTGIRFHDAAEVASDTAGTEDWRILPRVVACGGRIILFYGIGGIGAATDLLAVVVNPAAPQTLPAPVSVVAMNVRAGEPCPYEYAVAVMTTPSGDPGAFALAYSEPANGITVAQYSVTGGVIALAAPGPVTVVPVSAGADDDYAGLHLWANVSRTRLYLAFKATVATGGGVFMAELHTFNASTHAIIGTTDIFSGTAPTAYKATVLEAAGATTAYVDSFGDGYSPMSVEWDVDGAVTSVADTWQRMVHIAGEAFAINGETFIPCTYPSRFLAPDASGVQPTFMLLEAATGRVVLRAMTGATGGTTSDVYLLPSSMVIGDVGSVLMLQRGRVEFDVDAGVVEDVTPLALSRLDISLVEPHATTRLEENRCLHAGGGNPALYDGSSWVEDGFHVQPEGLEVTIGMGGSLSSGTYSWVVCYEWTDAQGRLHRSAPAVPASGVALTGENALVRVSLLHLTRKHGVKLALYRTTANGTIFYRTTRSANAYIQEDPGAAALAVGDFVLLSDGAADTTIRDNEILPFGGAGGGSVGGELWHRPPPAYRVAHKHGAYIFVIPMDDPQTVRYSLPLTEGESPAWADELALRVPSAHGRVTALATVDDKLIIACERGAYAVYGQGPLRDGSQNGFTEPVYITGSVGCSAPGSMVETPDGIMYAAASGLHLLTRGLETVKLGAPVDPLAANSAFTRAIQLPDTKELRWYTQGGRTLVYSSEWRQWGTWTLQPTLDAVIHDGLVFYADGTGVRVENPLLDTEVGTPIEVVVETAWLKWAGMQGLQRIWKAYLMGTTEVTARVRSDVYYEYDDTAPGQTLEATVPGSTEGGPPTFRIRQTMAKQLCTALRFKWTITRESTTPTPGGTVGLSSLTLEFGTHRGASKRNVMRYQGD